MPRNESKAGGTLQKYPNWLPSPSRGHGHEPARLPCQNLATDKGKPLIFPQNPANTTVGSAELPGLWGLCLAAAPLAHSSVLYSIFSPPDLSKAQNK